MNQPAPMRYATLSLGNRSDAAAWEEGCKGLGLTQAFSCIKPAVSADDVVQFFGSSADWIFMAGHSNGDDLYGEATKPRITFARDAVTIFETFQGKSRTLRTNDPGFRLRPVRLVVFAGCAPFTPYGGCAPVLQALFGGAAVLGTSSLTGPAMVKTMFSGLGRTRGFFGACKETAMDPVKAWLATAAAIYGGGAPAPHKTVSIEDNFRALDAAGQHWKIKDKAVVGADPIR